MFDSLIDSRSDARRHWRPSTLALAIVLHVAVLGVLVVKNYFSVPPIPRPALTVRFARFMPPPPPAAPAPPRAPAPKVAPKTPPPTAIVQPQKVPDVVDVRPAPPPDTLLAAAGNPEGVEGGVPGGVPGGAPDAAPAAPQGPLRVGGDVSSPQVVSRVQPVYPSLARAARLQGTVVLEPVIRRDGTVGDIRVVQSLGMGLTEAAIAALKQWRFKPGDQAGVPVDVYMTLAVQFRMSN